LKKDKEKERKNIKNETLKKDKEKERKNIKNESYIEVNNYKKRLHFNHQQCSASHIVFHDCGFM